jgi:hypothetical protein
MELEKVLYTAKVHAVGGRDGGSSRTDDGHLDVKITPPGHMHVPNSKIHLALVGGAVLAFLGTACMRTATIAGETESAHSGHLQADVPPPTDEILFLKENDVAMAKMMKGMDAKPSGDVDRDFVEMMIPHHQGAIDMSQAVLKYGKNERIRRLAQEIVVTQQEEIAAMRLAVGQPLPPSTAAPTDPK